MMKICSDKCVHCIFDQTSYYALFIIVLLMLNWNCLKVTVPTFYCCYLWTAYKKSTIDRLRVAFNKSYRRVLGQPWRCSTSAMYANFGINNFEATIRKSTFGFIQRLAKSINSLIVTIEKSWSVRIDICYSNMNLDCKCLFYY